MFDVELRFSVPFIPCRSDQSTSLQSKPFHGSSYALLSIVFQGSAWRIYASQKFNPRMAPLLTSYIATQIRAIHSGLS